LRANVRHAGEGGLKDQPSERFTEGEFTSHTTAQRFAESNNVVCRESAVLQPMMRRLGVEISALLAGPASAPTKATIIKEKDAKASVEQGLREFQAMTDISCIAVANQHRQVRVGRRRIGG